MQLVHLRPSNLQLAHLHSSKVHLREPVTLYSHISDETPKSSERIVAPPIFPRPSPVNVLDDELRNTHQNTIIFV
jgi:hypothetical protein